MSEPTSKENFSERTDVFVLPRINYGPLAMRVLKMFTEHFSLTTEAVYPDVGDKPEVVLSKILTLMIKAMGQEKTALLLMEAKQYRDSLPPSVR